MYIVKIITFCRRFENENHHQLTKSYALLRKGCVVNFIIFIILTLMRYFILMCQSCKNNATYVYTNS